MKKLLLYTLFVLMGCCLFSSCDDDGGGGGLTGYYVKVDHMATTSQFDKINEAITFHTLLSSYSHTKYYATRSLFFYDDGRWRSSASYFGACRFMPKDSKGNPMNCINVVQILNNNTLIFHIAYLWDAEKVSSNDTILGQIYAGSHIGDLVYLSTSQTVYTYAIVDNKLVVSNGDIYTIVDGGLIKDGTSGIMRKYNPNN